MSKVEDVIWQHLADACLEHDADHCRRACEALRAIFMPEQRAGKCSSEMTAADSCDPS